ncbi:MAG: 2-hydroxyacyl-CoA dehydratase [Candidatus Lernaella stagnicola]|nr:2-hydroxyacyl-CoA dehydratase [Candidatus Lernaella stagnicola]
MTKRIGITTTVPHEIIVAAGYVPVDLNNVFADDADSEAMVASAEDEGFPAGVCAWIKGLYAAMRAGRADAVVTVVNGDCSNTQSLAEVLRHRGIETIPFSFPAKPQPDLVERALQDFAAELGTELAAAERVRRDWQDIRRNLAELDRLAWRENKITSAELHHWLLSSSDFGGDANAFGRELDAFLDDARRRPAQPVALPLALLGVPPIFTDLFARLEERGARFVFCEVPRQFSMPYECRDLVEQFCRYTYPYDLNHRLDDLLPQLAERRVAGAVHYVQAFCHRQIDHIVIKDKSPIPVLALEGDRPGTLSGQAVTRLDAFLEMLA